MLIASGLPYTIIRPCRLTDGPYTSYDLNTLLKASSGSKKEVKLSLEDNFSGEASRIFVAGKHTSPFHLLCPDSYSLQLFLLKLNLLESCSLQYCLNENVLCVEAIVQSLQCLSTEGNAIAIESIEGEGPRQDLQKWEARFSSVAGSSR